MPSHGCAAPASSSSAANVPEFALEGYTRNEFFGVTRNPWNADLTPGGSTAGGRERDGGPCSGRNRDRRRRFDPPSGQPPGLVGFKPSIGRWPRTDSFPTIQTDFETVGTLNHTMH